MFAKAKISRAARFSRLTCVLAVVVGGLVALPAADAIGLLGPSTPGKVTGGGFIIPFTEGPGEAILLIKRGVGASVGGKATFGFVSQFDAGQAAPQGNLVYDDHGAGVRIKAVSYDSLVITGCAATFTGTAMVNGALESLMVEVFDGGEPGSQPNPGVDTFVIGTDTYGASGPLIGGNIQVHGAAC